MDDYEKGIAAIRKLLEEPTGGELSELDSDEDSVADPEFVELHETESEQEDEENAVNSVVENMQTDFHGNSNRYKIYEDLSPKRMVDITRDKPIKVGIRVIVPVRDHPKFNFVGKLLGPKGNSLKRLQEETMTKMAILGRGSMRDRHKEEELRSSGDPRFGHLLEDLHVEITAFAPPAEAHARIAYALSEVRRFLVPDYNDEIRQEQMWEMQILNTSSSSSTSTLNNAGLRNTGCSGGGEYAFNAASNSNSSSSNNNNNSQENTNDDAAIDDMLLNGNDVNVSSPPCSAAALAAAANTAAVMSGLLAAAVSSSPTSSTGQLNLDNFNGTSSPHGFPPLASPNGSKLNNGLGQINGGFNMEFCAGASSSNGSLSPPEFANSISSSPLLMSPHSAAIRAFKAKSAGGAGSNPMTGRKRPLLSGGNAADIMGVEPSSMRPPALAGGPIGPPGHMFMSPSKRTVLSILAKAKAAQHKDPIVAATAAAAVAASGYKHHPHIAGHHSLTGIPPPPFRKNTLFPNPANLLLN